MDDRAQLPFRIDRVDSIGGRARLVVSGELDVETASRVERVVASERSPTVELDLAGVTFIDSTGLNALIAGCRGSSERIVLVAASPQVRRVIELSGLEDWFADEAP